MQMVLGGTTAAANDKRTRGGGAQFALGGVLLSAVLVIAGSFGPWVTMLGGLVRTDGVEGDGRITLVLGILAGAAAFALLLQPERRAWLGLLAAACLAVASAVGLWELVNVLDLRNAARVEARAAGLDLTAFVPQVGWGLPLTVLSAGIGSLLALLSLLLHPQLRAERDRPLPESARGDGEAA
jgi:hypothetical protein